MGATRNIPRVTLLCALGLWAFCVLGGTSMMLTYASTAEQGADAPKHWPKQSSMPRFPGSMTLLMFAHPYCPCTYASFAELARTLAVAKTSTNCTIVFTVAEGLPAGWEESRLVQHAKEMVGASVRMDLRGHESRLFGARTSGQVILYGEAGRLLFSGGITPARGHQGDSRGKQSLIEFLNGMHPSLDMTPVFGCPLFDPACDSGATTCAEACTCQH